MALRNNLEIEAVSMGYFERALKETGPSVTPEMEEEYRRMVEELKQENPRSRRIGFQ